MPTFTLNLGLNSRGADVEALHKDLQKLGLAVPAREAEAQAFGPATRETILRFQAKIGLPATGILDDATRAALESAAGGVDDQQNRIEGRVFVENGVPADGVVVRVYTRGFGGAATRLGEARTDERGFYSIPYARGNGPPHLELRTPDPQDAQKEIPLSETRFNADRYELVNLVAPASLRPRPPEFQALSADLTPHVGELSKLADAQESGERRDLSLLHEATGWDGRLIATAATAAGLAGRTGLTPDALYALFRIGLPTSPEDLARVGDEAVAAALKRANEAGIVALSDQQVADARKKFTEFSRATRLAARAPGTLSSPGELLAASGLNGDLAPRFADLVLTRTGPAEDLWQKAEAIGIARPQIDALQLQGKLAYLTLNNVALAEPLRQEVGHPDNLARMVDLDLHKPATWKTRLNGLAGNNEQELAKLIPPGYAQEKVADRLDAYAGDLARQVRASFPTQVVGRMVATDELRIGPDHAALKPAIGAVFQKAAGLQFELGRTPVGPFVRDHADELFQGIAPEQVGPAIEAVKTLHRLYQITPTDEAMQALAGLGFRSAQDVAAFAPDAFVQRFGNQFRSHDEARLVHRKAQQVSAVAYNLFTGARSLESAPDLHVTSPPAHDRSAVRQKARDDLVKQFPTLKELFGSPDYCECEHCRSVLSPAAYLVDLFQFLDPEPADWDSFLADWKAKHGNEAYDGPTFKFLKPFDALVERRPDLPRLELTCENTHTAMPYIDIVNEVLEYYVAHDQLKPEAARQTGTAATPDLLAEPQNVEPTAYQALAGARYPLSLPFDLWLETVRRLFDSAGIPLARVLDVFRPTDDLFAPADSKPYDRAAVFAESLGLSPAEFHLVTDPDPLAGWHTLYGYDDPARTAAQNQQDALAALPSVKALARRLAVTYRELADLVRTRFINPRLGGLVLLRRLGLDAADVFRFKKHPAYEPLDADEEQAFLNRLDLLTTQFNPNAEPDGFDARKALDAVHQDGQLDRVLLLADPEDSADFDHTVLRFADTTAADGLVFLRINLFVRLWRKLGWTIEETDRALCTFSPTRPEDLTAADLGPALRTVLIYTAHLKALDDRLLLGKESRLRLLTFWANLPTTGADPLYARLFLVSGVLEVDPVFDDPLGDYLSEPGPLLRDHLPGLQAGLNLTADEIGSILTDAGQSPDDAKLTLATASLLFRHGVLARGLRLSVQNLLALRRLSGLDPFRPLAAGPVTRLEDDSPFRHTLAFVEVADRVRETGFRIEDLQYLLRHEFDPVGKYRPDPDALTGLVRELNAGLRQIEAEQAVPADPAALTDDLVRQRLGLVRTPDVVERFFGFWNDAIEFAAVQENVPADQQLFAAVHQVDEVRVRYDVDRQRQMVVHIGVLTDAKKAAIQAKVPAPPADAPEARKKAHATFTALLDQIATESHSARTDFVVQEFDGVVAHDDVFGDDAAASALAARRKTLLTALQPVVRTRLVRQLVVRTLAARRNADPVLTEALLTEPALLADPDRADQPLLGLFTDAGAVDRVDRGWVLLSKVFQVIEGFGLTEREVRHILTHRARFGGLDLGKFPIQRIDPADPEAKKLAEDRFRQFLLLAEYTRLKRELAGGTDDLIGVFEAPADAALERLAELTRRDPAVVAETAEKLGVSAADLAEKLPRLWDALRAVEQMGIPADAIVAATKIVHPKLDPDPAKANSLRRAIARDVRAAVKARYAPDDWRQVAKPVFDALRQRQRDALVSHVLHRLEPKGVERAEQLFEYFLIDPGMEPVVQTSRLRLAISAIQTFVQRCLLNLEPRVHPSALDAGRWEWMKQYRMWEANRKIFLFPENWLEPEFRDDKTHLFTELEGALLQGDVSNDLVADALFTYLKGLEEIARLQIVTVCAEEIPDDPAATVLHVIGRTYGLPHRYFYRRFARQAWTAWEPVGAEIEGDHITAVVWRERLHLFWVTFLEKPLPPDPRETGETGKEATSPVFQKTMGQLKAAASAGAARRVEVQLNWSEYYQGEWTPRESTGFVPAGTGTGKIQMALRPADGSTDPDIDDDDFGGVDLDGVYDPGPVITAASTEFDPASVFIHAATEYEGSEERAVRVSLTGRLQAAFRLMGKGTRPVSVAPRHSSALPYLHTSPSATEYAGSGSLAVRFAARTTIDPLTSSATVDETTQSILGRVPGSFSLTSCFNLLSREASPSLRALTVPFFFQDDLHTYFVDPTLTETTFREWRWWGIGILGTNPVFTADGVGRVPTEAHVPIREHPVPGGPADLTGRFTVRGRTDWMADPATVLRFGDRVVGRTGGLDPREISNRRASVAVGGRVGGLDGVLDPGGRPPGNGNGHGPAHNGGITVIGGGGLDLSSLGGLFGRLEFRPGPRPPG